MEGREEPQRRGEQREPGEDDSGRDVSAFRAWQHGSPSRAVGCRRRSAVPMTGTARIDGGDAAPPVTAPAPT